MPAFVQAHALSIGYAQRAILPPLNFCIEAGQLWALVGPNGAGKSTLLKTLLQLLPPVAGRIERASRLRIAYVPQRQQLAERMPWRVWDLVDQGCDRGWAFIRFRFGQRATRRKQIEAALERFNLMDLRWQSFSELSEGQKQRTMLARTWASAPQFLVLDEATSAADLHAESQALDTLEQLVRDEDIAVLMATHHAGVIPKPCTHALFLDSRAQIVRAGRAKDLRNDAHLVEHYAFALGARDSDNV